MPSSRLLLGAATGLALGSATAFAQTIINSVPYTISASGKYQLGTNLVNSDPNQFAAITITAPNVILDLHGFFVSGPGSGNPFGSAISVVNVGNVTVRNGTVANAGAGITMDGNPPNLINCMVENVNFTRCFGGGVSFGPSANGSVLRNCTFSQIGSNPLPVTTSPFAIRAQGGVRIENNSVSTVTATGSGVSTGIVASATDLIIGNTISNAQVGINGGKFLNNLTSGCATPFLNGVNATGNN